MSTFKYQFMVFSLFVILIIIVLSYFFSAVLWILVLVIPILLLAVFDIIQKTHSILRLYPVIGHFRFLFESVRIEMQQYFVENDTSGTPINREFRSLIYQRAKGERDTRSFGTQFDIYRVGYEWTNHTMFPKELSNEEPRVLFGKGRCRQPYAVALANISAMSYGALSQNAIRSLNLGAKLGNFYHNTGEGGISSFHLENGGDLVWQIGTGYFGCRSLYGCFDKEKFKEVANLEAVKMIEIKLSQGAKPGHGGLLPAKKVTKEIAQIRGVAIGKDVVSPSMHTAFSSPIGLLNFVEELREISGKPVGFKLAVGKTEEFLSVCKAMLETNIIPDFITVDGGEGGTGAAPVEFANSIGTPLREALHIVNSCLIGCGLRSKVKIIASGKVFSAFHMYRVMALGADTVNLARSMMLALGCVQSKRCNTNECPTGVATQNPIRSNAIDVALKSQRVANFQSSMVYHFREMLAATGKISPQEIVLDDICRRVSDTKVCSLAEVYPVIREGCLLDERQVPADWKSYWDKSNAASWD